MKTVLMISYWFPPISGSGVHRVVKFAKYLPYFGWKPIILTVDEGEKSQEIMDTSLLDELPKSLNIYRSKYFGYGNLDRFFIVMRNPGSKNLGVSANNYNKDNLVNKFKEIIRTSVIPDVKVGWYPLAISKSKRIFKENNIDLIYSSSPPPTAHLIGMSLAKKYKKPWIADFRDPWTGMFLIPPRPFPLRQLDEYMEERVLDKARKIVVAWPGIEDDIVQKQKDYDRRKIIAIHNGFDQQDFQDIIPKIFPKFTITYTGVFYKERNPAPLFRALNILFSEQPMLRNDIQVIYIGKQRSFVRNLIEESNVNDIVITIPNLPHKKSLSYLLGSDVLFLNTVENYVPGKVYEYLRSKKPILALVPKDTTVAKIVSSTKSGIVIDPTNTEEIKDAIFEMYKKYKKGTLKLDREDDSVIYQYERKELTRKLAEVFNEVS